MNRADILSELSLTPLLMEEPFGHSFIASMAALPERLDWYDEDQCVDNSRSYPVVNGIAVIPIIGTLMHRPSWSYYYRSSANYLSIADMVLDAVTDSKIKAVLLEVDSHGGMAAGCLDLAESIQSMRGVKPIWASVNQTACSAGFALAGSVDRVEIAESAKAGSIGVMAVHWDYSKALEKWGEKVTYLYAGKHKIDGATTMPLTEQARKEFMASIEAEYERFCNVVAAGRGMDVNKVRATEAAVFRGKAAVDAGLADQVATFEETMMSITKKTAPDGARFSGVANPGAGSKGEKDMNAKTPEQIAAEAAAQTTTAAEGGTTPAAAAPTAPVLAEAGEIAEACQAAGFSELTAGLIKAKPTMEAVKARIEEAKQIKEAAAAVGMPTLAGTIISSGVNLETARKMLFDAKAAADGGIQTDPAHTQAHPQAAKAVIDVQATYKAFNSQPKL